MGERIETERDGERFVAKYSTVNRDAKPVNFGGSGSKKS